MSRSLYYRPPPVDPQGKDLSDELKFALRKRWPGLETGIEGTGWLTLLVSDVEFLEGLLCAGIKDAEKLIEAIAKYGSVQITEHG